MSVIPEILLQRVVVNGFRTLRKDPRVLDALFKNLTQEQLQNVKAFVLDTAIDFSVNYPRQDLKIPSLVLVLKNETESIPFIGDSMNTLGVGTPVPDVDLSHDTLGGHGASISGSSGLPMKLAGPLAVLNSVGIRVNLAESAETLVEELLENPVGCAFLYVVKGTGAGQIFPILRIRSDSLDIQGDFESSLDGTSVVDIRAPSDPRLALGEPSRVYDAQATNLRRIGSQYEVTYHLHIIAGQQDEVIFLYSVIKALFLSQRRLLEAQGIIALKISGSDFAPKTEYLPSTVFQRMMVLTFTYPFSFLQEQEVATTIRVVLSPDSPDEGPCDIDFTTTISL